jgi:hypothetical protein
LQRPVPVHLSVSPGSDPGGFHGCDGETKRTDWVSRNPRDAECGDNLLNGAEMKTETQSQSQDRDREATTGRFPLALFIVAELLCTGVLVASVILWI